MGIVLALLLELLIVLALLTLGTSVVRDSEPAPAIFSVNPSPEADSDKEDAPKETESTSDTKRERQNEQPVNEPQTVLDPAVPSDPVPVPPAWLQLSRDQMAASDLSTLPKKPDAAGKAAVGPPDTGTPGDTPKAEGRGPNGETLYAAAWYREPYDDELRGYLSTASGPGWALIACRTVPNFRVDNCIALGEYPGGSGIASAVLAAAWQFRVRPPRLGGQSKVGEWVRIRIDYGLRRR